MTSLKATFGTNAGRVAFGSISGTYASVLNLSTATNGVFGLIFNNSTDAELVVSMDGGTSDTFYLAAGMNLLFSLRELDLYYQGHIQVKHAGTAPTVRGFSCGVIYGALP